MNKEMLERVREFAIKHARIDITSVHGITHWDRVANNGVSSWDHGILILFYLNNRAINVNNQLSPEAVGWEWRVAIVHSNQKNFESSGQLRRPRLEDACSLRWPNGSRCWGNIWKLRMQMFCLMQALSAMRKLRPKHLVNTRSSVAFKTRRCFLISTSLSKD